MQKEITAAKAAKDKLQASIQGNLEFFKCAKFYKLPFPSLIHTNIRGHVNVSENNGQHATHLLIFLTC